MDFQQMVLTLQKFWSEQNCILGQPYDMEKGAGTMNPLTFLRVVSSRFLLYNITKASFPERN